MQQTLTCLIQLQQVDSQILEIVKVKDTHSNRVNEFQLQMDEKSSQSKQFKTQISELEQERKAKEQLLHAEEDKLRKWERRLNESKNSREATPLAREIDAQKRLNQESNEDILRLLTEEERLNNSIRTLQKELEELRSLYEKEDALCKEKTKEFEGQLSSFQSVREKFSSQLRDSILNKYDAIKDRRGGLAVVAARNGCCTGCNMRLRPQLYNIIQKMQSLETCPSCQRILYWEEGLENGLS